MNAQEVAARLAAQPVRQLVNGELRASDAGVVVVNPATGEPAATAPKADKALLDEAVAAARAALPAWQATSVEHRRAVMHRIGACLRDNARELGAIITLEQGKPLDRAIAEVTRAAFLLDEIASIPIGNEVLRDDDGGRVELHYRALGVVGAIAPWNVPIGLAVPKIVHALYPGNTLVLKPSPFTPLSTLRMGEMLKDLLPAGVINVLSGDDALGRWMSEHPGIDKISFTGSIATGRHVMASSAVNLKSLTLELGGNDPAIVLEDVDIDQIAPKLLGAAFINSGQVCMAIKRLYVHDSIYAPLVDRLAALTRKTVTGDPFRPGVDYGPLQNRAQQDFANGLIEDARSRQARMWSGPLDEKRGYFVAPTLVTDIGDDAPLVREEQFAPILPVLPFSDLDDVIARANAGDFGLASSVWTATPGRAAEIGTRLRAGTVWTNHHVGADPHVPFGGLKQSGAGAQFGLAGLRGYMERSALYLPGD